MMEKKFPPSCNKETCVNILDLKKCLRVITKDLQKKKEKSKPLKNLSFR